MRECEMDHGITERVQHLKDRMLLEPRFASIEQAKIITECYKEHEEEPRIMQRARALQAALTRIDIRIDPEELIVGNRTPGVRSGVVFPESGSAWVDRELETLPTREQDTFEVREEDISYFRKVIKPYWEGKSLEDIITRDYGDEIGAIAKVVKINQKDHAQGHICPKSSIWLEKGPAGLREEAILKEAQTLDEEKKNFYRSVAITMDGAIAFMKRYADLAEQMAEEDEGNRESLRKVSGICRAVARHPARSFHEAVQSLWFLFVILQMESNASSFSPGRLDMILEPYFQRDTEKGLLSMEDALELLECLFLKFNQIVYMRNANSAKFFAGFPIGFNIAVGGQDKNGSDFKNELSFLFLQSQENLGLPQPNLSVRLHEGTTDELLKKAIRVVAKGSGMPQFFNDKAVIPSLEDLGVSPEHARDYGIVGCVELSTQGNNLGWSDAAMFNLNKVFELTLTGGICLLTGERLAPDYGSLLTYQSFEELEQAFAHHIDDFIEKMVRGCEQVEKVHMELLPSPFLSAVIDDCMQKGTDVTAGGAHYNFSGIQMIQVANLADSFAAVKQMIFDEKRFTPEELLDALQKNFEGYEIMRTMLVNKVPKYGNDVEWVDRLGCKWAEYFKKKLSTYINYRGGAYHTGMYTVSAHIPMGKNIGATPDGRYAGTPLADGGMSPVYGRDVSGPTAVLKSVSKLDKTLTSNGGLLNMKFLPSFFATESGISKFALFLRSFVDLEIPHIQFNVVCTEDLIAAQKNPDQYRGLTVRVAGYTAYFTELAGELQNEIITRTAYEDIA